MWAKGYYNRRPSENGLEHISDGLNVGLPLETAALDLQSVRVELRSQSVIAQGVGEGDGESVGGIGLRRA